MLTLRRFTSFLTGLTALACLSACEPDLPPEGGPGVGYVEPGAREVRDLPANSGEGMTGSLLDSFVARGEEEITEREVDHLTLPFQAKRVVTIGLLAVARDDVELLESVFTEDARWGFPDRREPMSRAVADDPDEFIAQVRNVSARLKRKANWKCPPMLPGPETTVSYGAEPMWCWYASDKIDPPDHLVFKLVVVEGRARIDYVGFFPEPVDGPVRLVDYGPPPPVTPPPRLARRDPGGQLQLPPGVKPITVKGGPSGGQERPAPARGALRPATGGSSGGR